MPDRWFVNDSVKISDDGRVKATLKIGYAAERQTYVSSTMAFGYSLSESSPATKYDIMIGRVVPSTQRIMNHFPRWMKMRIDPSSNGNKFVNSIGQNVEHVAGSMNLMRRELFLSTADRSQPSHIHKLSSNQIANVITGRLAREIDARRNILLNSNMAVPMPVRIGKAWRWQGQYTRDTSDALHGSASAKLTTSGTVYQYVDRPFPWRTGTSLTFSAWHKTDSSVSTTDKSVYSMAVHLVYDDESRSVTRTAINPDTGAIWRRASMTVVATKPVVRVEVQVSLASNSYISNVWLDCLQLEENSAATQWTMRVDDKPWYVFGAQVPSTYAAKAKSSTQKYSVWLTGNEHRFLYELPPTRAEIINVMRDASAIPSSDWGEMVDHNRDVWPTKWSIHDNVLKRENILVSREFFYSYDIGEIDATETKMVVYDDLTRTLLAVTVYRDMLYVLCTETLDGTTSYVLKVLKPHVSAHTKTYLETYIDFSLDIGSFVSDVSPFNGFPSGDYVMAFDDGNDDVLAIQLPDRRIVFVELHFDYGFVDEDKAILYLREDYNREGNTVIAI